MKKVLLLTLEWPPMKGGVAEYLSGIFGALPKEKVAVRVAPERARLPLSWLLEIFPALRELRRTGAELVVVSHVLPMGTAALLLKRLSGRPYAVIVHGKDLLEASRRPQKKVLAGHVLRRAELVIANSRFTAGLAARLYGLPPDRTRVVHPCPSASALRPAGDGEIAALRRRLGLEGKKVLLSVGRLVRRKNFGAVIRLLPKLRRHCGELAYVIVGAGPEEARWRAEAKASGVGEHVVFAGEAGGGELSRYYGLADLFVAVPKESANDVEGFGIVFLEAALHGLAVVAGRTGGVPEAVLDGETGLLVAPEDENALFEALSELLRSPEKAARLGRRARERVLAEFTCAAQADRLERILA